MTRIFKVPLLDGYDIKKDKNGDYKEFCIEEEYWNSTDESPKKDGEYLLAVWDGYDMNYDVCYFKDNKWEVTNDWYEGEPIAYVAWIDIHTIHATKMPPKTPLKQ